MNTNFQVIGLTQLGIKPQFTAPEADALTTRPTELLIQLDIAELDITALCVRFLNRASRSAVLQISGRQPFSHSGPV